MLIDVLSWMNSCSHIGMQGQPSWNFFENTLSNHVPDPEGAVLKLLARKFRTGSRHETKVGLSDMAAYYANGYDDGHYIPEYFFLIP